MMVAGGRVFFLLGGKIEIVGRSKEEILFFVDCFVVAVVGGGGGIGRSLLGRFVMFDGSRR